MSDLFSPFDMRGLNLNNRIIMAPMTRSRASGNHVPTDLMAEYYGQRASAGLIITEAIAVSLQGCGYPSIPGLWNDEQTQAWRKITDAVHAKGGKIFAQLFHTGRIGHTSLMGEQPVSATAQKPEGEVMSADYSMQPYETPRALAESELPAIIEQFVIAVKNAKAAGFDGVEIHGANGYLLDQFLRDGSNDRTDAYGGSLENRVRLLREVTEAAIEVYGAGRVGLRLSPYNPFNTMSDSDPVAHFAQAIAILDDLPLAYLHMMEPYDPAHAFATGEETAPHVTTQIRAGLKNLLMVNGGLTKDKARSLLSENAADLFCFGALYISNPDLVERFNADAPLTQPNPETFYAGGAEGYTDYSAYQ